MSDRPRKIDSNCSRCTLCEKSRTICCPGSGPLDSKLWLWGEALGSTEEQLGRPFTGDAGWKLNYCLDKAGIKRKKIRIENTVRCRPPGNKKPSRKQIEACWPYSLYLILKHKPKVIVALGATAFEALVKLPGKKMPRSLDRWRGFYSIQEFQWTSSSGKIISHKCIVVPTYHPAFCIRKWEADDLLIFDLKIADDLANEISRQVVPDTKVQILKSKLEALAFLKLLKHQDRIVLDIEDTSLQVHDSKIMCIGFCTRAGNATILPIHLQGDPPVPAWSLPDYREIISALTSTLESIKLVGQNIKYDIQRLRKLTGIIDFKISFDTMVAHHVIDENKPHNLTFLSQWYLDWSKYDAPLDQFKSGRNSTMNLAPDQLLHNYCGNDVDATFRISKILKKKIKEEHVEGTYRTEHGLILPLADMEYRGIHLDRNRILALADENRKIAHRSQTILIKYARNLGLEDCENFNPRSTSQIAKLLKAAKADLWKKTPSGKEACDKLVLNALALKKSKAGTIASRILELRRAEKVIGTYLDGRTLAHGEIEKQEIGGFLQWLQQYDRIHTNYNIAIARTGRLSADDPPLQTIPRTGGLRSILIPDLPGHKLICADYRKLELCVIAWISNDRKMAPELISGIDLHRKMAVTVRLMRDPTEEEFKKIAPDISKNERAISKCFHPDTEVLTKSGWKKIPDLQKDEEIIQACPMDRGRVKLEWTIPLEIFSIPYEGFLVHLKAKGIDLRVTPNHRMLGWGCTGSWVVTDPLSFNKVRYWANAGRLEQQVPSRFKERILRLAIATQADGSYFGRQIKFGFTKKRKIRRFRRLLKSFPTSSYTESISSQGVTTFVLRSRLVGKIKACLENKSFPWRWIYLPNVFREIILDEVRYWDSHKSHENRFTFMSTDLQSIDILQAIAAITGRKTRRTVEDRKEKENHRACYRLSVMNRSVSRGENVATEVEQYRGNVACLSVKSSFILVRDGGVPCITGQSVVFGINYGRGARAIAEANPDGFPANLAFKDRVNQVQRVIDTFFKKYEGIARYQTRQVKKLHDAGIIKTAIHGRLRRLYGIDWFHSKQAESCSRLDLDASHLEREALNCEIQSIGSDILSQATKRVYAGIKKLNKDPARKIPGFRIVMSLHDALIFNVDGGYTEKAIEKIKEWMEIVLPKDKNHKFEMPILVDCSVQNYWGEGEE